MQYYLLVTLVLLPFASHPDPAPSITRSRSESRTFECERVDELSAVERFPGRVPPIKPRGDYVERDMLFCQQRLMRPGLRPPLDEAVLSTLDSRSTALAQVAVDLRPDLAERTWLVESHFPTAPVASKISFATKNALVGRGLAVSDRLVNLAAGDVDVLSRLPPDLAYAGACKRYSANGSLGEDDVLLAVAVRDQRDTNLHAGLCVDGQWAWLQ